MIIKYELESFIKEIESKLSNLEGKAKQNAIDKVNVLNRVSIEFMEYEDLMRKMALQHNEMKAQAMRMALELTDIKKEIVYLKENIK